MDGDLNILECPISRVPLTRSGDDKLVSTDGRYEYRVQDNIARFVPNISPANSEDNPALNVQEYYRRRAG